MTKINDRINVLDSFRFLAILSVMLYHFYPQWLKIYPKNLTDDFRIVSGTIFIKYGFLGVQFFFYYFRICNILYFM